MQGSNHFTASPSAQNRNASLDNKNLVGSRNGNNRQNAAIGLSGYPPHMNNTTQDINMNAGLIPSQNLTQNGATDAQYR